VQDIPTVAESGLAAFDLTLYSGVIGPAGMPREIVERMNGELAKVVNSPEIKEFFATQGRRRLRAARSSSPSICARTREAR